MAIVRKKKGVQSPVKKITAPKTTVTLPTALPTQKSKPASDLRDYTWLIHGDKKIGKTSLCSHFDNALIAMFEPGGKGLSIYQTDLITDWSQLRAYVDLLESGYKAGTLTYRTFVIDPGNRAYDLCLDWVCRSVGVKHPHDANDFGKTWRMVSSEFQKIHERIAAIGMGFIVLAHDKVIEVENRDNEKLSRTVPVLTGSTEEFYAGVIDIIGHYHYIKEERFLQIRGDEHVQAGNRCERNFLTPSGTPVVRIPMGRSSKQAYDNVVSAFNNEQLNACKTPEVALNFARGGKAVTSAKAKLMKRGTLVRRKG